MFLLNCKSYFHSKSCDQWYLQTSQNIVIMSKWDAQAYFSLWETIISLFVSSPFLLSSLLFGLGLQLDRTRPTSAPGPSMRERCCWPAGRIIWLRILLKSGARRNSPPIMASRMKNISLKYNVIAENLKRAPKPQHINFRGKTKKDPMVSLKLQLSSFLTFFLS